MRHCKEIPRERETPLGMDEVRVVVISQTGDSIAVAVAALLPSSMADRQPPSSLTRLSTSMPLFRMLPCHLYYSLNLLHKPPHSLPLLRSSQHTVGTSVVSPLENQYSKLRLGIYHYIAVESWDPSLHCRVELVFLRSRAGNCWDI